jgi:hypothetical protein
MALATGAAAIELKLIEKRAGGNPELALTAQITKLKPANCKLISAN